MATIINTPNPNNDTSGAAGWVVAIVAIIALAALGFYFYTRDAAPPTTIQYQVTPADTDDNDTPPTIFNTTVNATTTNVNSTTTEDN